MPATRLSVQTGSYAFDVDRDGAVLGLRAAGSGQVVLERVGLRLTGADGPLVLADRTVLLDEDETQLGGHAGALRVELRHAFAAGWTSRLVLSNTGDEPYDLHDAVIDLRPAAGVTGWRLVTGTEAWWAFLPATGPVLAARSAGGRVAALDDAGLHLGPVQLAPGERRVVRLLWDWFADPAALRRRLPDWLPTRTVTTGEADLALRADPDQAVVFGPESQAWIEESTDAGVTVVHGTLGRVPVELRSARGTAVLDLGWAPPIDQLLADAVREVVDRPRSSAGLAVLTGIDEALVVQRVVAEGTGAEHRDLTEALDLYTARTLSPDGPNEVPPDTWRCCYAIGEAQRLADPGLLQLAERDLVRLTDSARRDRRIAPGLGLATSRLSVALLVAGGDFSVVVARLAELVADPAVARDLAWWEAALTTRRQADCAELAAEGRRLGAMLPGGPMAEPNLAAFSQRLAVLQLLPETGAEELTRDWGLTPAELVQRAGAELALRLHRQPVGPAHRWLAVVDSPG